MTKPPDQWRGRYRDHPDYYCATASAVVALFLFAVAVGFFISMAVIG